MSNKKLIQAAYLLLVEVVVREFSDMPILDFVQKFEVCEQKLEKHFTFKLSENSNISVRKLLYFIQMGIAYEYDNTPALIDKKMIDVKHLLLSEDWTVNNFLRLKFDAATVRDEMLLADLIAVEVPHFDIIISKSFVSIYYKKVIEILTAAHAMPFDREEQLSNGTWIIYIRNQYVSSKYRNKLENMSGVEVQY